MEIVCNSDGSHLQNDKGDLLVRDRPIQANTYHFATVELNGTDETGNENYNIKSLHEIPPDMKEAVNEIITALSNTEPTEETVQLVGKSKKAAKSTTITPKDTGAAFWKTLKEDEDNKLKLLITLVEEMTFSKDKFKSKKVHWEKIAEEQEQNHRKWSRFNLYAKIGVVFGGRISNKI